MAAFVLFASFLVMILISVPIGYALGISTFLCLYLCTNIKLIMISQNAIAGVDSFPLMAIPFFILAGNIMSKGGLAKRLINFANLCVGRITGGLAMVTTAACMFFAAVSGSAVATTSAVGGFMIPEMQKKKYDVGFSAALAATAGTIGIVIPPSIPLVLYGVAVGVSIGDLFKAAIIPGILIGLIMMSACYFIAKKEHYVGDEVEFTWKKFGKSFLDALWALLAPGIILGGIYTGVTTPTEAAVIAVLYSLFVSIFIYREITPKEVYSCFCEAMYVNGTTSFMIGLSMAFAAYLTLSGLPQQITASLLSLTSDKIIMLAIINIFLLLVGSLIDPVPAIIILSPILLPVVVGFGMSPVHFGVIMIVNLAIGYITPPYGVNLFVAMAVAKIKMERMFKYILYLFFSMLVALILITYIPFFSMYLVR